jgi:hypothetical protein
VSIEENDRQESYQLKQNFPNPFTTTTTISYTVGKEDEIQILVYGPDGKVVKELVKSTHNPGTYHVEFDGSGLVKGAYICRIIAGSSSKALVMIKD